MAMIFIGGSRDTIELPEPAIARIGAIVAAEHGVLVGDAPGVDTEAQSLLAGYRYEHVGVFHSGRTPRNNLGDWAAYHIPPLDGAEGYELQAAKDREMARRADFGLMIWDGDSPGTALNIMRLAVKGSPCVVYETSRRQEWTVRTADEWQEMLHVAGPETRVRAYSRMTEEERDLLSQ
ncbi:hypothetical protein ATER59S_00520 [Aquamicrobium terrae]